MKVRVLSLRFLAAISVFMLLVFSSCKNEIREKQKETAVNDDAFSVWSDTIVKAKYEDGTVAEIWGFRAGDSLMHYDRKFYRNGGIWIEGPVYGDIRHGKWKAYDEDGHLISMGYYKMGVGEGIKTVWHSNGKKFYEGEVSNGERVGVWEFYDENGIKVKEIDYSQRNKKK